MQDTDEYQICRHCGMRQNTWRWSLIESYPKPLYEILCKYCVAYQEITFTVDRAVTHALVICAVHHAALDTQPKGDAR